jgi:hypothetical protein
LSERMPKESRKGKRRATMYAYRIDGNGRWT